MRLKTPWLPFVGGVTTVLLVLLARSAPSMPTRPSDESTPVSGRAESIPSYELPSTGRSATSGDFRLLESSSDLLSSSIEPPAFALFERNDPEHQRRQLLARVPYGEMIDQVASRYSVDPLLLAAIVEVESGFDATAVSPRGAIGLTQIMPNTGEHLDAVDLHEPAANLDAGARYLRQLQDQFDGDVGLMLAAYNAGPGNVARFGGVPPFRETRQFISRVLGIYVRHQEELRDPAPANRLERLAAR